MSKTRKPFLSLFVLFTMLLSFAGVPVSAVADIVTTTDLVTAQQNAKTRAHLNELLARNDVRKALTARGVDVTAAQKRVANMTDAEVQALAANIDQLPAGGRRLSTVELLLLIIIIILII